jgi:tetratricopeptide (TPR) repeat protein
MTSVQSHCSSLRVFTFAALFALLASCAAQPLGAAPAPNQLGKVNFPTSCSADVQPTMEKALALLHSFQYKEADQVFTEASTRDPKCAMAHWGKAMSLYHQLWDFPDGKTLKAGKKEIDKARKSHATSEREKGFITAAASFYQKKSKLTHAQRIQAYSSSLADFSAKTPGDSETASFYALSLVALAEDDVDETANLKKAIEILTPMLQQYPDHPGIAHYLIHATDRPELAPQGLEAARRYAAIAPDSAHALHMPSHIFVRLGLWQDSIASNVAANASGAHAAEEHKAEAHYQTHAMDFLSYSYLQSGQEAKAREIIEHADHVVGATDENKKNARAYFEARTALELHRWKDAAALPFPETKKPYHETPICARAIGAARSGDIATAEAAVKELSSRVAAREQEARKSGYPVSDEKATDLREAEAWLAFAKGKSEDALQEMRAAADHQDKEGGESVNIPAREMLADMLMELKRPADALSEYRIVLKNAPNRFDALLGAARAANATGDHGAAQTLYAKLAEVCAPTADRPELAEARTVLAQK